MLRPSLRSPDSEPSINWMSTGPPRANRADSMIHTERQPVPFQAVAPPEQPAGRVHDWERRLLARYLASLGNPPVRIVLWDGSAVAPAPSDAVPALRIRTRGALLRILLDPGLNFGDAYRDGDVDVDSLVPFLTHMFSRIAAAPRRSRF